MVIVLNRSGGGKIRKLILAAGFGPSISNSMIHRVSIRTTHYRDPGPSKPIIISDSVILSSSLGATLSPN